MKINLGRIEDEDVEKPWRLGRKLREVMSELERAFQRIRVDGPLIIGGGQTIEKHYSATKTWDPGSVSDAAQTTTTVTVTGAALGDEVTCSFSLDLQAMQLTGYVSATDTVTCVLRNGTGAPIDLNSGTLRASVWRH